MIVRGLLMLVLAATTIGCDVLAPVVTSFPNHRVVQPPCDVPPSCDALSQPPSPVDSLSSTLGPDDACGFNGRVPRELRITEDASIDGDTLGCVDLEVIVEGEGSEPRTITLTGVALEAARIHVSAARPVALRVESDRIDRVELEVDGPVAVTFERAAVFASRVVLDAEVPLSPPELLLVNGSLTDVEVVGPRTAMRIRGGAVNRGILSVGSLVMERGHLANIELDAALLEIIDAEIRVARLRVGRIVAATGVLHEVYVEACGAIALSDFVVSESFIAACDEAVDLRDVSVTRTVLHADVVGRGGGIRYSVLGSHSVALSSGGAISDSAFCGTESVDVSAISCVRCDPGAPPDLCAEVSAVEPYCPGLCASLCGRISTVDPASCAP